MFDQEKKDPSKKQNDDDEVIVSDYLKYDKEQVLKTEGYYVTKAAQVKGILSFNKDFLQFDPVKSPENEIVKDQLQSFHAMIDYRDIGETEIIKLVNEKALMHENDYVKEAYLYDYLIQIDLTTVNGLTCKTPENKQKLTIANVFFRF